MRGARAAVAATAVAAAIAWAPPASAQSKRYPPPPTDYDEEEEQHSNFWERTLHPHKRSYEHNLRTVARTIERADRREQAVELLNDAIEWSPERPDAYWYLGQVHAYERRWKECAAALAEAHARDPLFQAKNDKDGYLLDYRLGTCQSRAGEYEDAIATLKRIIARGHTNDYEVYVRLGESYMALGRLREAIAALTEASKIHTGKAIIYFALAVAYDRDEQPAKARAALETAVRINANFSELESPRVDFAPAEDQYYYLGLAHAATNRVARAATNRVEWAIYYFRHYLYLSGEGPWVRRARDHIEELRSRPRTPDDLAVSTVVPIDRERILTAVTRLDPEMQTCLTDVPGALFEIHVTKVNRDYQGRAKPGVKASLTRTFDVEGDQIPPVLACLESAAKKIALPTPKVRDAHLRVGFYVIAR